MRDGNSRGVVHHIHHTAVRAALLEPRVEGAIQLHQFSKMFFALAALPMRAFAAALAAPQSGLQHPAPQSLGIDRQTIFFGQMLRR